MAFGQLFGEFLETIGAAGDEQQLVAVRGQVMGERRADAGGRAGDEGRAGEVVMGPSFGWWQTGGRCSGGWAGQFAGAGCEVAAGFADVTAVRAIRAG